MALIRFNTDEVFQTDSSEYEVLQEAASHVGKSQTKGAVAEIGTRRGGSAKLMMDTLAASGAANRSFFCIDPYGNIDLEITNINASIHYPGKFEVEGDPLSKEEILKTKFDYTNVMRNRVIPSLYYYAYSLGFNFQFFPLEDTEFFSRYADGVPVYEEEKYLVNDYALVFLDGPHTREAITRELEFFIPRMSLGSVVVNDDVWMVDNEDVFVRPLKEAGFEVLHDGKIKTSMVRTRVS